MAALAMWTPEGGVLGAVAPLGLAASMPTALVVDLDRGGPSFPGDATLAQLVREGPTRRQLVPERSGLAVLSNGGVAPAAAAAVLAALIEGWPHVVVRLPPSHPPQSGGLPTVPVHTQLGASLFGRPTPRAVVQTVPGHRSLRRLPGVLLPVAGPGTLTSLAGGRLPPPGNRWVRAWRRVWELPWTV